MDRGHSRLLIAPDFSRRWMPPWFGRGENGRLDSSHDGRQDGLMPTPSAPRETSFDIAYLLSEIEELRRIADHGHYGTLAYLLECAAIEAKWQAQQQREAEPEPPAE